MVEGGFYNSADNTITWDQNTLPDLASVDPGANGTLGFTFSAQSLYQGGTLASDPQIDMDVSISGKEPQEGTYSQDVNSIEHKTVKLTSDFQIAGDAFYSIGPFTNSGPFPPKVDGKTTYTIKLSMTSSANDISNVVAKAALPPYVHFLSMVNPTTEDIHIDPVSGNLVWNVGTVPKGSGFTGNPRTVYFQVELDPSATQLGTAPVLVNSISASGTDTYTNTALSSTWKEITTRLLNDPAFTQGDENVSQ